MTDSPVKLEKLAYSFEEFAELVSISYPQLLRHIRRNDLVANYSGRKGLITRAEGERFLRSLPNEKSGKVRS